MKYEEYLENYFGLPVNVFSEDGILIRENVTPVSLPTYRPGITETPSGKQFGFAVSNTTSFTFPLDCEYELVDDTWYQAQY